MYTKTIKLNHNELPAAIDQETGEIRTINKSSNIPNNKEVFEPSGIFKKTYNATWSFLLKELTPLEFKVASQLCIMAKMNTNSLEPLNDDTTITEISEMFDIHRNSANKIFKRLFDLGVYAKFEVAKPDISYTKYWILNPYLSFSGKLIDSDITRLFEGTIIAKEFDKSKKL